MNKNSNTDQEKYEEYFWDSYNDFILALKNKRFATARKSCRLMQSWAEDMDKKQRDNYLLLSDYCTAQLNIYYCGNDFNFSACKNRFSLSFLLFSKKIEKTLGFNPCVWLTQMELLCESDYDKAVALLKKAVKQYPSQFMPTLQTLTNIKKAAIKKGCDYNEAYEDSMLLTAQHYAEAASGSEAFTYLPLAMVTFLSLPYYKEDGKCRLEYMRLAIRYKKMIKDAYTQINGSGLQADEELKDVAENPNIVFLFQEMTPEHEKLKEEFESI